MKAITRTWLEIWHDQEINLNRWCCFHVEHVHVYVRVVMQLIIETYEYNKIS
jgi:hypothetical protein